MTSAFNYALQAFANKHSSPTLVTAFFPLQVVFTALFSWMLLDNTPRPSDYAGAGMIVAGGLCPAPQGDTLVPRPPRAGTWCCVAPRPGSYAGH